MNELFDLPLALATQPILAHGGGAEEEREHAEQLADAHYVFRYLVLFQACLASFAHGANDTANATGIVHCTLWVRWRSVEAVLIGPFVAIWRIKNRLTEEDHTCASGR